MWDENSFRWDGENKTYILTTNKNNCKGKSARIPSEIIILFEIKVSVSIMNNEYTIKIKYLLFCLKQKKRVKNINDKKLVIVFRVINLPV